MSLDFIYDHKEVLPSLLTDFDRECFRIKRYLYERIDKEINYLKDKEKLNPTFLIYGKIYNLKKAKECLELYLNDLLVNLYYLNKLRNNWNSLDEFVNSESYKKLKNRIMEDTFEINLIFLKLSHIIEVLKKDYALSIFNERTEALYLKNMENLIDEYKERMKD